VTAGLVDRRENPDDRREVAIELTERGRLLVDEVTARRRRAIEGIVRAMPVEQRAAMIDALLAFAQAADEPLAVGTRRACWAGEARPSSAARAAR